MEDNGNKKEQPSAEDLKDKLDLAEKERDEYLNGWKRAKADLINAKKEWAEQLKDLSGFVQADWVRKILPVLDALDKTAAPEGWAEIKKLLGDILKKEGLEEIEALGREFNPEYHESAGAAEGPEHQVVEVLQKGYQFKGQVIRAARVKIGKQI